MTLEQRIRLETIETQDLTELGVGQDAAPEQIDSDRFACDGGQAFALELILDLGRRFTLTLMSTTL